MTATQTIGPFEVGQRVAWIDPDTFRLRVAELTGYDPETDLATLESGDTAQFMSGRELVARCVPEGRTPIPLDAVRARLVAEVGWEDLPRPETDEEWRLDNQRWYWTEALRR